MLRPPARLLALALTALVIGACSSDDDDLSVEDFREGDCRTLAPAVLDVGRLTGDLDEQPPTTEDLAGVTTAQEALRNASLASADLTPPVQQLVVDLGFLRLRTVSNTYAPELADAVERSYDALVAACTSSGS